MRGGEKLLCDVFSMCTPKASLTAKCDKLFVVATMGGAMPHEHLKQRLAELLGGALGLNVFPSSVSSVRFSDPALFQNPWMAGIRMSILYASLFCGLPWLLFSQPSWSLFFLQIYGCLWAGWATTSTKITSSSIEKIIENDIIPELSAKTAEAIEEDLALRFETKRLLCVSWGIAIPAAALAGVLIYFDASNAESKPPAIFEVVLWSVGWSLLFATAAKVVNVSRFYRLFAAHLKDEPEKLYAIDPARSTLVASVAFVAQRMLLFWLGIAISIALVLPFSVKDWGLLPNDLATLLAPNRSHNRFVLIEIAVTAFFSIGLGTIVFLRSEAAIRQAVRKAAHSTLHSVEVEVASLSNKIRELDETGWKRLTALSSLHKEVAMAGSYRSAIISALSVIVPFVPLVSLFLKK
jgi:hypothetical protein